MVELMNTRGWWTQQGVELGGEHRLDQMMVEPRRLAPAAVLRVPPPGERNDEQRPVPLHTAHGTRAFVSVEYRQADVHDYGIVVCAIVLLQRIAAIIGHVYAMPLTLQQQRQAVGGIRVVIHHQHVPCSIQGGHHRTRRCKT
jgi:hypothetical protein